MATDILRLKKNIHKQDKMNTCGSVFKATDDISVKLIVCVLVGMQISTPTFTFWLTIVVSVFVLFCFAIIIVLPHIGNMIILFIKLINT